MLKLNGFGDSCALISVTLSLVIRNDCTQTYHIFFHHALPVMLPYRKKISNMGIQCNIKCDSLNKVRWQCSWNFVGNTVTDFMLFNWCVCWLEFILGSAVRYPEVNELWLITAVVDQWNGCKWCHFTYHLTMPAYMIDIELPGICILSHLIIRNVWMHMHWPWHTILYACTEVLLWRWN